MAGKTTAETPEQADSQSTEITVHEAWSNVMNLALGLGKHGQFRSENAGNFNYRSIDDVMNLVGPLPRQERMSIIPSVTSARYRDVTTGSGRTTREVTVQVDYAIYGPAGDVMMGTSVGESLDSGDKGTAKAMSVAFRVFLLQALCLPTDEPDPDSEVFQRAGAKPPGVVAQDTADRVPGAVTVAQLDGVKRWAADRSLLDLNVNDAAGNSRPLLAVIDEKLLELDPTLAERIEAEGQQRSQNVDQSLGGGS